MIHIKLNDEQYTQLLKSVEKSIYTIVNRYSVKGYSDEDLFQECQTRLWEIRDEYDPLKGEFTTFVYSVLPNYIRDIARKESNEYNSNHIKVDGVHDVTLKNTTNYDLTRHVEFSKYSKHELDALFTLYVIANSNDKYKEVLEGLLRNRTYEQIGVELGLTRQAIGLRVMKILNEVKGELRNE